MICPSCHNLLTQQDVKRHPGAQKGRTFECNYCYSLLLMVSTQDAYGDVNIEHLELAIEGLAVHLT